MIKQLLNSFFALCLLTAVQAQEVELSFSLANNDFGEVLIDNEKTGTLTITNNTNYGLNVTLNTIIGFSNIPGYHDVSYPYGKCSQDPTASFDGSNLKYAGLLFSAGTNSSMTPAFTLFVDEGSQSTVEVTFVPREYTYSYISDISSGCVRYDIGGCIELGPITTCTNVPKSGLGQYDIVVRANYNDNGENIRSATDIEIDGEAVTELSTVNSVSTISKNELTLSPNPATDFINVEKGELIIMNSNGEVVLTTISDGQVDVSSLEAGFYVVSLDGKMSKLVIK